MDHAFDYCAAKRAELAELVVLISKRGKALFTDGRFRHPAPARIDGLIAEYARLGKLMRKATEAPGEN